MSDSDIAVFAETTFRNKNRNFGIKRDDRRRHMYLIGKTGMGKSTILENMIIDDIRSGNGVAVVDPHGDLAEKVIKFVPKSRMKDVVYFNPADYEHPIAFNVLEQVDPHLRHLVSSGLIGVFQKLWAESWGPRLEYILRNTILAVLDYPGSTLLSVTRMLSDKKFRKKVVDNTKDPVVKAFWEKEFAGYADKFASEAVSPIQNKVGQFLSTALIRNIVGQAKSTIDMRDIMDSGKILILNLSKGRIGEDSSQLLGAMVITKIQLAAMSRVDTPEDDRRDFYLYIDEFQNFTTDSFANILSEARKYKLNLIMAHQYIEQLGDVVRHAVFGNVGTLVVFRVGAADAQALEPEFTPTFLEEDILNLPKYEIYLKLMIDGIASEPFSARGLHPLPKSEETNNVEELIAMSRATYSKTREDVETEISDWHTDGGQTQGANNQTQNNHTSPVNKNNNTRPSSANRPQVVNNTSNQNNGNRAAANVGSNQRAFVQNTSPATNNNGPVTTNQTFAPTQSAPKEDSSNNSVYKFTVNCSRCGGETKLPFKPDGIRPVYCKNCLSVSKDEKRKEVENRKKQKEEELKTIKDKPLPTVRSPKAETPKQVVAASTPKVEEVAGLSLDQALKMNPVNFKGKTIEKKKPVSPRKNILDVEVSSPPVIKPIKKEDEESEAIISPPVIKPIKKEEKAEDAGSPPVFRSAPQVPTNKPTPTHVQVPSHFPKKKQDEELDFSAGESVSFE